MKTTIALVKQISLPDLYVCETKSSIRDVLFSTMMRVGPLGLFHEFDCDFYIVNVAPEKECNLWKEINQTPINGPVELLLQLEDKLINEIPGQEFKKPGSTLPNGYFAKDVNEIDWSCYDIVISLNISVPSHIVKKNPNTLWCYMFMEPNQNMDKVYFNYDVSLNHYISGISYGRPGVIDFPYTFLHPGLLAKIIKEYVGRDSLKNGIFCDISCSKKIGEEKHITTPPQHLLALKETGFELKVHQQNIRDNLKTIYDSKYVVKVGGSPMRGNSVIEAISLGSLFIGDPDLILLKLLVPSECRVKNTTEALRLIERLETCPEKFWELWWMQRTISQLCVIDRPSESLHRILTYKRTYGPLKETMIRKLYKKLKKFVKS